LEQKVKQLLVEHDPSPMKLEVLNVDHWPLVHEPEGVVHRSTKNSETSYIVSGSGEISTPAGESVSFVEGDLITVMPDTQCTWNITEAIERHYYNG